MTPRLRTPARGDSKEGAASEAAIAGLSNLGPKSAAFLQAAGIRTLQELERLGSVAAYAKVKKVEPRASLNLLWALEGALTGLDWREVARTHRTSLLLALEALDLNGRTVTPMRPKRKP